MTVEAITNEWLRSARRRQRDIRYISYLIPLAAPTGLCAIVTARIVDGRQPIFRQVRRGKDGIPFVIYKVRSQSAPGVPTRIGHVFRFTSVDELPQFYNVTRGEMSLFGPRPLMPSDINEMSQALPSKIFREWLIAYDHAGPGCLSSFAHFARRHGRTVNRQKLLEMRAALDTQDVKLSSPNYERLLLWRIGPTAIHMIMYPGDSLY